MTICIHISKQLPDSMPLFLILETTVAGVLQYGGGGLEYLGAILLFEAEK